MWDRQPFPRDKVCAGWITPHVVAALELDLDAYAAGGRTCQPIFGFQVSRQGDREARVRYAAPVSYGIRRREFDHYLLERSGAERRLGAAGAHARAARGALGGERRACALRCWSGRADTSARSRSALGAQLGHAEPVVSAQETEFALTPEQARTCRVDPDVPEIFFTRDLRGYGWVFRKGDYINIGLGRQGNDKLGAHVGRVLCVARSARQERPPAGCKNVAAIRTCSTIRRRGR